MNNDFVNRALENAKLLQQTVADAVAKGSEQAKPLVADAVARAQDLQKTLIEQAPQYGEAAQAQLRTAQEHLRQAIHLAAKAVTEATAPKPPEPPGA